MASINILTDVVILVMPLPALGKLNMHRKKRWALMGIFMVGGVAVLASIVRLYALWVYTTTRDVAYDAIFVSFPRARWNRVLTHVCRSSCYHRLKSTLLSSQHPLLPCVRSSRRRFVPRPKARQKSTAQVSRLPTVWSGIRSDRSV